MTVRIAAMLRLPLKYKMTFKNGVSVNIFLLKTELSESL